MNTTLRNILAVIIGIAVGSAANMGLVNLGHAIFPIEGIDPENMEQLAAVMPTLSFEFFIFPFLAHAIGTLVAALVATKIGIWKGRFVPIFFSVFFLAGGIAASFMIHAPTWFVIADLSLGYIPMAFLGHKLGR